MNNTRNTPAKQDQINQQEQQHQQQKTRQEHGPKKGQDPNRLRDELKPQVHDHERPETRLTR